VNAWRRLTVRATLPLRRHFLRRRVGRLVCEEVEGIPLIVLPTVFNAAVFGSSDVLVRALRTHAGACGAVRGRLLDMGTGTGIGAIAAAQLGYEVVAVDLNPDAVRCARINALQHRLEDRVQALEGDLFAPVAGRHFDVVLFNPPFFEGAPRSSLDRAWRSVDVPERFGAGLPGVLAPGGVALVIVSSHGGRARTEAALRDAGLRVEQFVVEDLGYEQVTVLAARHHGGDR
jgi:HemK-related putative methylase